VPNRNSLRNSDSVNQAKDYQKRNARRRQNQQSFGQKEIDVTDYIFAPEGYETFMFSIYFITLPYLVGLGFLYFFVAQANFESFLNFNIASFFVIWAIGYEVCAGIILTFIAYAFVKSFKSVV